MRHSCDKLEDDTCYHTCIIHYVEIRPKYEKGKNMHDFMAINSISVINDEINNVHDV